MEMKNLLKCVMGTAMLAVASWGMVSCSDDDNPDVTQEGQQSAQEQALQNVIADYLDKTVVPTYRELADATIDLHNACLAMLNEGRSNNGVVTSTQLQAAIDGWFAARKYWELSEAWLYGAASDYNIDPHIDSWPLDANAMQAMLDNDAQMAQMDEEGYYVGNFLGYGLLGFHAVEYLLFDITNTGSTYQPHSTQYTQEELLYLAAVAGDLRNQCVRLEASWAGIDNVTSEKQTILTENELEPSSNYGEEMRNAGQAGSRWNNYQDAAMDLISSGIQNIANEVGNIKIGNPTGLGDPEGGMEYDPGYIESPYAVNSIVDFVDNIISCQNAYEGFQAGESYNAGVTGIESVDYSLSAYIRSVDPELDNQVRTCIDNAISAIQQMQEPFQVTAGSTQYRDINQAAVDACNALNDIFNEVMNTLTANH